MFFSFYSVPLCPLKHVDKGNSDFSSCPLSDRCGVHTTLQYTCEPGFVVSSPTTKCMEDHTWNASPTCVPGTCMLKTSCSPTALKLC